MLPDLQIQLNYTPLSFACSRLICPLDHDWASMSSVQDLDDVLSLIIVRASLGPLFLMIKGNSSFIMIIISCPTIIHSLHTDCQQQEITLA